MITMLVLGSYLYPLPKVRAQLRAWVERGGEGEGEGDSDSLQQNNSYEWVALGWPSLSHLVSVILQGKQYKLYSPIVQVRETEAIGLACQ